MKTERIKLYRTLDRPRDIMFALKRKARKKSEIEGEVEGESDTSAVCCFDHLISSQVFLTAATTDTTRPT